SAHERAENLFSKYAEKGDNEVVKAFAAKVLPGHQAASRGSEEACSIGATSATLTWARNLRAHRTPTAPRCGARKANRNLSGLRASDQGRNCAQVVSVLSRDRSSHIAERGLALGRCAHGAGFRRAGRPRPNRRKTPRGFGRAKLRLRWRAQ